MTKCNGEYSCYHPAIDFAGIHYTNSRFDYDDQAMAFAHADEDWTWLMHQVKEAILILGYSVEVLGAISVEMPQSCKITKR